MWNLKLCQTHECLAIATSFLARPFTRALDRGTKNWSQSSENQQLPKRSLERVKEFSYALVCTCVTKALHSSLVETKTKRSQTCQACLKWSLVKPTWSNSKSSAPCTWRSSWCRSSDTEEFGLSAPCWTWVVASKDSELCPLIGDRNDGVAVSWIASISLLPVQMIILLKNWRTDAHGNQSLDQQNHLTKVPLQILSHSRGQHPEQPV